MDDRMKYYSSVVDAVPDAPVGGWKRTIAIPSIVFATVLIILLAVSPPFACSTNARGTYISPLKILVWSILAASATIIMNACGVYGGRKK